MMTWHHLMYVLSVVAHFYFNCFIILILIACDIVLGILICTRIIFCNTWILICVIIFEVLCVFSVV